VLLTFLVGFVCAWGVPASALDRFTWTMPARGASAIGLKPEFSIRTPGTKDEPWNVRLYHNLRAYRASSPGAGGRLVMYDPESGGTLRRELRHPRRAMRRFARLAGARGDVSFLAPAQGITRSDRSCRGRDGEKAGDQFLRCRYAAVRADYFLLQSQRFQCTPRVFAAFVATAARQARAELIVEVSVTRTRACEKTAVLLKAMNHADPYTDRYALWFRPEDAGRASRVVSATRPRT
jgi:hypothetical protein